jgi:hypothetical protein
MTKLDHDGTTDDSLLWSARAFIYQHFAATARAPGAEDIACHFNLTTDEVENILRALHDWHALFLEPGTARIRMANPFSAVATPYEVIVGGMTYWANCAWDTFGLAAALHASEAEIRSVCAHTGAPLRLRVAAGEVESAGEVVHFRVPFRHWYDNLVFT